MSENMKVFGAALSLVVLLAMSVWGNALNLTKQNYGLRNPASEFLIAMRSLSSLEAEAQFASELAEEKKRDSASIGRPADPFETLRFGVLEGKYAMTISGEKVSEVSFVDTPSSEGRPTAITDRMIFLKNNALVFDLVGMPQKISSIIKGTKTTETYRASSKDGKSDILVHITFDDLDRLLSLKTEQVTKLKYF